jgi:putative endonuclease
MTTFATHSKIGNLGEALAARYLTEKGYNIVTKNYYYAQGTRRGEIDIIAERGEELFFVEVKTRTGSVEKAIFPEQAISRKKLEKMAKAAERYVQETGTTKNTHFEALAVVYFPATQSAQIKHFQDIFF